MGLFSSKVKLSSSGLFDGRTDWHCHILPGVDDGFGDMEDSLAALALMERAGYVSVWMTPHIMEDIPNSTAALRERFSELERSYAGGMKLRLASENMLDNLFLERLERGDLLPMDGNRLLVETSYFSPPVDMDGILAAIRAKGYFPLLAHPERYMYMDMKRYRQLKSDEVEFQLSIPALAGSYGPEVKLKAEKLLEAGMYECSGTDLHRISSFEHLLSAELKKKYIRSIP